MSIWLLGLFDLNFDISVIRRCHSDDDFDFDDSLCYSFSNFAKYQSLGHISMYHMQFKLIFPIIPAIPRARTKSLSRHSDLLRRHPKWPQNKIPGSYPTTTTSHQGSFKSKIHFSGRRDDNVQYAPTDKVLKSTSDRQIDELLLPRKH